MRKLYKHQQELLDLNPKQWLLSWGTGSGKTLAAIELVKKNNEKALVIVPKPLLDQWEPQVPSDWLVITKEQFRKRYKELPKFNSLILDESHYFSNYKSQLTKALLLYIKKYSPEYRYLLTATPYLSTSWNIYTYGLILDKNWNWWSWNNRYFSQVRMGRRTIPVQRKYIGNVRFEDEMKGIINNLGNTISLNDCFDVPEQIFQEETFSLTRDQRRAMEEYHDPLPIVNFTRQHQICGGSLKGDEYREDKFFKSEKLDRVLELIEYNSKIIIVCRYNNEIDMLRDRIKDKEVLVIRGDVKDRHSVCQRAEALDNCVVLIQASCSEGYELPSFPLMVFYSYDFSLKNYIQILGRIQRANNINKNVYKSLYVKGTIDEDIYKTIMSKRDFDINLYAKGKEEIY